MGLLTEPINLSGLTKCHNLGCFWNQRKIERLHLTECRRWRKKKIRFPYERTSCVLFYLFIYLSKFRQTLVSRISLSVYTTVSTVSANMALHAGIIIHWITGRQLLWLDHNLVNFQQLKKIRNSSVQIKVGFSLFFFLIIYCCQKCMEPARNRTVVLYFMIS